jgi:predicted enzyme related to lactoylglutathione lyase
MACHPPRRSSRFFIFAAILAGLLPILLAGCLTATADKAGDLLPPITSQATKSWHPGRIVWLDLVTPDAAAAKKFYGGLFGWQFKDDGRYTVILNRQQEIGGIIEIKPEKAKRAAAQWLATMSVADVDAAASWTTRNQGQLLNGPVEMSRRGYGALIQDPAGSRLVLLKARDGDPPEKQPEIGDWLWLENWTMQLDRCVRFYKELGSYERILKGDDYVVLINENKWRAGIRQIREKAFSGQWVPAVRVRDAGKMLSRVKELGGSVWLAPGQSDGNPDTALITDNNGALLILQPWDFTDKNKEDRP